MPSFGARLEAVFASQGQLCLGIDPHSFLLQQWNLPDTAQGAREFGLRAVDAAAGVVGIIKPQVAFFERHGSTGYAALEEVLAAARAAGLLVIADAKRGDVGSTVAAYGAAWLSPGSPLEADSMTVSAYQGLGSLAEVIGLARAHGKGLFVLAATSNPEAAATQTAVVDRGAFRGQSVAASIVAEVDELNAGPSDAGPSDAGPSERGASDRGSARLGSIGVVIGATVDAADYGIAEAALRSTPVLAPGFGEQGAELSDVVSLYGAASGNVIVNLGRSVLRGGSGPLRAELQRQRARLAEALAP